MTTVILETLILATSYPVCIVNSNLSHSPFIQFKTFCLINIANFYHYSIYSYLFLPHMYRAGTITTLPVDSLNKSQITSI